MKLVKLTCPNCGGKVKADAQLKMATCKYCHTEFLIDSEQPTINNYYQGSQIPRGSKKSGGIIAALSIVVFIAAIFLPLLISVFNDSSHIVSVEERMMPEGDAMKAFVSEVFRKDMKEIKSEDLSKIQYLSIQRKSSELDELHMDYPFMDSEIYVFKYSFKDFEKEALEFESSIQRIEISSKAAIEWQDVQGFTGLKKLDLNNSTDISGASSNFSLKSMKSLRSFESSSHQNISSLEKTFYDSSKIIELGASIYSDQDIEKLIEAFPNVEALKLTFVVNEAKNISDISKLKKLSTLAFTGYEYVKDISWLSSCVSLKSLTLNESSGVTDLSSLYALSGLEELNIKRVPNVKTIDFINNMPNLHRLQLVSTGVMDLSPLSNRVSIQSITLDSNENITNYEVLGTLSSLQILNLYEYLDSNKANTFDVRGLPLLKKVDISGYVLPKVANMPSIEQLTVREPSDELDGSHLAGMQSLNDLKLLGIDKIENNEVLATLPNFKSLYLNGLTEYSGNQNYLFNLPVLEKLELIDCALGIDEDTLGVNEQLKTLIIQDVRSLRRQSHEQEVQDDLNVGDFPVLLSKLVGLRLVDIKDGNINSLGWVTSLGQLEYLNVSDNYISDVSPLISLPQLSIVNIKNNPISNKDVLDKKLFVISD